MLLHYDTITPWRPQAECRNANTQNSENGLQMALTDPRSLSSSSHDLLSWGTRKEKVRITRAKRD